MKRNNYTKFTATIAAAVLTLSMTSSVFAANALSIVVNDKKLNTDVPPQIINDRTMVPVRAVSEAVGCKVDWFDADKRVVVYSPAGGDPIIVMHINDPAVDVKGERVKIDAPPVIVNNRTLVPLRFIAETIGFKVGWNENTRTVYLYSALNEDSNRSIIYTNFYYLNGEIGETSLYFFDNVRVDVDVDDGTVEAEYTKKGNEITLTAIGKKLGTMRLLNPMTIKDNGNGDLYTIDDSFNAKLETTEYYYENGDKNAGSMFFWSDGNVDLMTPDGDEATARYSTNSYWVTLELDGKKLDVEIINDYVLKISDGRLFIRFS